MVNKRIRFEILRVMVWFIYVCTSTFHFLWYESAVSFRLYITYLLTTSWTWRCWVAEATSTSLLHWRTRPSADPPGCRCNHTALQLLHPWKKVIWINEFIFSCFTTLCMWIILNNHFTFYCQKEIIHLCLYFYIIYHVSAHSNCITSCCDW